MYLHNNMCPHQTRTLGKSDLSICCPHQGTFGPRQSTECLAKILIRLPERAGWSGSSLRPYVICRLCCALVYLIRQCFLPWCYLTALWPVFSSRQVYSVYPSPSQQFCLVLPALDVGTCCDFLASSQRSRNVWGWEWCTRHWVHQAPVSAGW